MNTVRISKAELLAKLKENRENHRAVFLEAQEGYREMAIKTFEENLESARRGRRFKNYISLSEPVDQTREYDRAILMLEMSADDVVEISTEAFGNFVMDQWDWSSHFYASNSLYSDRARGMTER